MVIPFHIVYDCFSYTVAEFSWDRDFMTCKALNISLSYGPVLKMFASPWIRGVETEILFSILVMARF